MKNSSQTLQLEFSNDYSDIFDGLIEIIPEVGLKLQDYDKSTGHISASVGISALSWGKNLRFIVKGANENNTIVDIESVLKFSPVLGKLEKKSTPNKVTNDGSLKAVFMDGYNRRTILDDWFDKSESKKHKPTFDKVSAALNKRFNNIQPEPENINKGDNVDAGKLKKLLNHMSYVATADLSVMQLFGYQALVSIIIYAPYLVFQRSHFIVVVLLSFHLAYSLCVMSGVVRATNKYSFGFLKAIVRLFFTTYILFDAATILLLILI